LRWIIERRHDVEPPDAIGRALRNQDDLGRRFGYHGGFRLRGRALRRGRPVAASRGQTDPVIAARKREEGVPESVLIAGTLGQVGGWQSKVENTHGTLDDRLALTGVIGARHLDVHAGNVVWIRPHHCRS
jgi:hypothetical protein